MRRHPLQQHRRARGVVHAFRQLHEAVRGDLDVLRVRRARARVACVFADGDARDAFANRDDFSRTLLARDVRQGHVVRAGALVGVDEVDAARAEAEHGLAGPGFGLGNVLVAQHLGAAELVEPDCFHAASSSSPTLIVNPRRTHAFRIACE